MKINPNVSNGAATSAQVQEEGKVKGAGKAQGSARIQATEKASGAAAAKGTYLADSAKPELSSKAKDMAKAKAVASEAPDLREEKIAELKRRIAEGKYDVSAAAVADRMVDDHFELMGS